MGIVTKSLAGRSDLHILRKMWHIVCGVLALSIYSLAQMDIMLWGGVAIGAAVFGFTIDLLRMNIPAMNKLTLKFLGPLMRKSEENGFSGLPFYALGVGLSIIFYSEKIALLSIMFLVFADPIASFVGVNLGKDKILPNKSVQGTIAAFLVCYFVTFVFVKDFNISDFNLIIFTVLAGIVGALSELASAFNIDDNLTIPVLSGAGLTLLNYFFHVF